MSAIPPPEPNETNAEAKRGEELRAEPRPRLFRTVWRWHFYAGLLVIPVVVTLCLSGIVYLFKPQLDDSFYGHLRYVEPAETSVSYDKQLASVEESIPGGTVTSVGPAPESSRSTEFGVTTRDESEWTVYVNPHTGRVIGHRDNAHVLTNIALDLHGTLLTSRFMDEEGMWGDRVIELAGSWAVVLVVTGVYLWWPRGRKRSLGAALKPRWKARSRRTFWRDVHADDRRDVLLRVSVLPVHRPGLERDLGGGLREAGHESGLDLSGGHLRRRPLEEGRGRGRGWQARLGGGRPAGRDVGSGRQARACRTCRPQASRADPVGPDEGRAARRGRRPGRGDGLSAGLQA